MLTHRDIESLPPDDQAITWASHEYYRGFAQRMRKMKGVDCGGSG